MIKKKMKPREQARQGDVLLFPITIKARGKDARENGRIILAHGEATGHSHEIIAKPDEASFEEITDKNDALFGSRLLRVHRRVPLRHQEHDSFVVAKTPPEMAYHVIRQREYHPAEIRNVQD